MLNSNISIISVSQLNTYLKGIIDENEVFSNLLVKGEISNLKYHPSGHIYFSLKDNESVIKCVMFNSYTNNLNFKLNEGDKIIVSGTLSVYLQGGTYQIYVKNIEKDGIGNLYLEYERLKKKLENEGIFSMYHKKELPKYPFRIGVATSSSGAALRDIVSIIKRRWPLASIVVFPCLVQGNDADKSIIEALENSKKTNVEVMIVGRGGGSIEDLWAFNEEETARAIFACQTPVISAVGHETDTTIADYVADLRAPTPSAAAELAVLDVRQILQQLDAAEEEMTRRMRRIIFTKRQALSQIHLQQQMEQLLRTKRNRLLQYQIHLRYLEPMQRVREQRQQIADVREHLQRSMEQKILQDRNRLRLYAEQMRRCSPLDRLTQGYGLIMDESGGRVHSVSQVKEGEQLNLYVSDGKITVQVQKIEQTDRE